MTMMVRNIPDSAVVRRIVSPSFEMSYPEVWHAEKIPENVLERLNRRWTQPKFIPGEITISIVDNVFVAEEGLVFTKSLDILQPTITQHSIASIDRARDAIERGRSDGNIRNITGLVVLCKKRGVENYGHWMIEMLPKAMIARQHFSPTISCLVHKIPNPLHEVMRASAALIGISPGDLIETGPEPVLVDRLLIVDGMTAHGSYMSPVVMKCLDDVAARIAPTGPERILVIRERSLTRRLVEEDSVRAAAIRSGYGLIDPGSMPFEHQVAAFKAAKRVVGVMGAGMTNLAFALPGTEVFNLAPASMSDTFFWFISGLRGLRYREVRCDQAGPARGPFAWNNDIILSDKDRARIFEEV